MVKRIIKVLVVTALIAVLMATTVSPAFAASNTRLLPGNSNKSSSNGEGFGSSYGCIQHGGNNTNCGWHQGTQ